MTSLAESSPKCQVEVATDGDGVRYWAFPRCLAGILGLQHSVWLTDSDVRARRQTNTQAERLIRNRLHGHGPDPIDQLHAKCGADESQRFAWAGAYHSEWSEGGAA